MLSKLTYSIFFFPAVLGFSIASVPAQEATERRYAEALTPKNT